MEQELAVRLQEDRIEFQTQVEIPVTIADFYFPLEPRPLLAFDHADYERWKTRLAENKVPIEKEVTWPSGSRSIYFRDPDNHDVELITKGNWPVID